MQRYLDVGSESMKIAVNMNLRGGPMKICNSTQIWQKNHLGNSARTAWFILLLLFFACTFYRIDSAKADIIDTSKDSWGLLGGYGQSIPGWGQTTERVETIDMIPRYTHHIFDDIGSGWYQGYHSILLETPVHIVASPDVSTMIGLNFLACYTFTSNDQWQPYLFGGGGPLYSFANIPGMGADWNGNYQFGLGLEYALADANSLLLEFRYHHISNGGSKEPNDPLNSCRFLIGVTF